MTNGYTVKDFEGIIREYDSQLMEANRKNVMLSVALGEVQKENEFLKSELEKLKEDQPEEKATKAPDKNKE